MSPTVKASTKAPQAGLVTTSRKSCSPGAWVSLGMPCSVPFLVVNKLPLKRDLLGEKPLARLLNSHYQNHGKN